ncbi:MAG: hypothetical protein ACFFG0_23280 [Candidatus Thorarchaeota archaeon]
MFHRRTPNGTPFEEGPNVIIIPTRLFTETIFNAHVQNETLDETPIYSADEEIFKFVSVGREGNTEQACDEVDFMFIRFDISSQDAMEILNLLLTCLVNETTNETAVTYSYVSTKENGTSATMMNLPVSVLGFIPWFCNFSDSPQGSKPKDFEDWFWSSLKALGKAIIGFIITLIMLIVELVKLIVDFIVRIFMEILPILGHILWLIIRTLLLIFIWIMFIITLLVTIILFVAVIGSIFLLNLFMNLDIKVSINKIITHGDFEFSFGYNIGMEYNRFIEYNIPTLELFLNMSGVTFTMSLSLFSKSFYFNNFSVGIIEKFSENSPKQSSSLFPKTSAESTIIKNVCDFVSGVGLTMGIIGTIVGIYAGALAIIRDKDKRSVLYIIGIILLVVSLVILIITAFTDENSFSGLFMMGMGVGCLITAMVFFMVHCFAKGWITQQKPQLRYRFRRLFGGRNLTRDAFKIFEIVDISFSGSDVIISFLILLGVTKKFDKNALVMITRAAKSLDIGRFAIFFSIGTLSVLENTNQEDKAEIALICSLVALFAGAVFIGLGLGKLLS